MKGPLGRRFLARRRVLAAGARKKRFSGASVGASDCAGTATARAKTFPHLMQINYPLFGSRYLYVNRRGLIVCKIGCYVIEIV
jgi:hypothetical protein